jgi:hypothetical protein
MKPIPKKLLIHSATIKAVTSTDRWGNKTTGAPVDLKYVRFEPSTKIIRDKQNNELQLSSTMFYDCKNSEPASAEFTKDTIITFNGTDYKVEVIEPLYDGHKLHHYELGLV